MSRTLGPKTQLDTLKKDAKRWLKAVQTGDAQARARLAAAWPKAPAEPTLRDIQHAMALDYGFDGWPSLKAELEDRALGLLTPAEREAEVLRWQWGRPPVSTARIAQRFPEMSRQSLALAVAFGDLDEVQRRLAADPDAAKRKTGPNGWEPLLYLANSRLPGASDNAVAIATLLLDGGADPNAFLDDAWENPFTVLTCLIGLGEGVQPPHPRVLPLVTLLLDRGADPFDTQTLYNTAIVTDHTGWIDALYKRSLARGDTTEWHQVTSRPKIGGKLKIPPVDFLLGIAVSYGHIERTRWLLAHGADPAGINAYSGRPHLEEALMAGASDMAKLLLEAGAPKIELTGQAAFHAALMRADLDEARRLAAADPARLQDPSTLLAAASHGRTDIVAFLLELGMPADLEDAHKVRAIHRAAQNGDVATARLLLDAGADVDRRGSMYDATPLGFANYFGRAQMVEFLSPLSRDVFGLARAGMTDRLDEVLKSDPALVHATIGDNGHTPLFELPEDEDQAALVASLLVSHGADPMAKNKAGETALHFARKRGLDEAVSLMRTVRNAT